MGKVTDPEFNRLKRVVDVLSRGLITYVDSALRPSEMQVREVALGNDESLRIVRENADHSEDRRDKGSPYFKVEITLTGKMKSYGFVLARFFQEKCNVSTTWDGEKGVLTYRGSVGSILEHDLRELRPLLQDTKREHEGRS